MDYAGALGRAESISGGHGFARTHGSGAGRHGCVLSLLLWIEACFAEIVLNGRVRTAPADAKVIGCRRHHLT